MSLYLYSLLYLMRKLKYSSYLKIKVHTSWSHRAMFFDNVNFLYPPLSDYFVIINIEGGRPCNRFPLLNTEIAAIICLIWPQLLGLTCFQIANFLARLLSSFCSLWLLLYLCEWHLQSSCTQKTDFKCS